MQIGPNSFMDFLKGRIGTPGINPNAPDPRLPRGAVPTQAPNWMDRLNSPIAQIGLNMLAAPRGTRLGEAAGGAVLNYQQQQRMAQEEELKRKYMEAQIQAMGTPNPTQPSAPVIVMGEDGKPRYATREDAIGMQPYLEPKGMEATSADLQLARALAQDPNNPEQVRAELRSLLDKKYRDNTSEPLVAVQTPDGPRLVPRVDAAGQTPARTTENVSEGERKAAALGTRLEGALRELGGVKERNPNAETPTWAEKAAGSIPFFGDEAANFARSPDRQRTNAAQLDALDAALTLATGAAYTREQLENLRTSYFPQLLDSVETRKAKEDRFRTIVEAARIAAGRAEPTINKALDSAAQKPQSGWGKAQEVK